MVIKLMIHTKTWMTKKAAIVKQKKLIKAERMNKLILEEYRAGIPAHPEIQEEPCMGQGKEELG